MANPIVLPPDVILGITTIKASGIDPNDFNNAVQELFNRGYGNTGKWIQDHKDLYLQALQDGYAPEGKVVPNSEVQNVVPPTGIHRVNDPVIDAVANPISPEKEVDPDADVVPTMGEDDAEEDPADKPHKRK